MPRIHIHVQDIDEIEDLEGQEDWELQLGLVPADPRHEIRDSSDGRARGPGQRREIRFGGSEAMDRKRSERRKQVRRGGKR